MQTMKHFPVMCAFILAFSAFTAGASYAQGKSGASNGRGAGLAQTPRSLGSGGGAQATAGAASANLSGDIGTQASESIDLEFDQSGAYGQLGASHATSIGDSMFLQLYGGVDFDQQSGSDPAGALNGRVGLGWKY